MRRLSLAQVDDVRYTPGRSLLLFLTDRCPVGCAHCSVDSRPTSPTIRDFSLFETIVDEICAAPRLELVGLSGGEPFVERRGLSLATERLALAGKDIVLYTSGIWAGRTVPGWVRTVLARAACVFLSTDAFHANQIDDERFVRAAQAVRTAGAGLVVQVLNEPSMVSHAELLLTHAFGSPWQGEAELNYIPPLPYGRGEVIFHPVARHRGASFGPCSSLAAPVIRYDGTISACCNERVIMGAGPPVLRRQISRAGDLPVAVDSFASDPFLRVLGSAGPSVLTQHPKLRDLADREFGSICDLCWAAQRRLAGTDAAPDPLLTAMNWMLRKETPV
jgi:organic radical activating enzyme